MSLSTIRSHLTTKLTRTRSDGYTDGGEASFYSLTQMLKEPKLLEAKNSGFFRDDAALAIVFISDENDICAIYPAGVTPVIDRQNNEIPAKNALCPGLTTQSILSDAKRVKGSMPLLFSAITYSTQNYPHTDENEYGYGYMELMALTNGLAIDMATGRFAEGLSNVGTLVTIKLNLITEKILEKSGFDLNSLSVEVDKSVVAFQYISQSNTVHFSNAGEALSLVEIKYCMPHNEEPPIPSNPEIPQVNPPGGETQIPIDPITNPQDPSNNNGGFAPVGD